MRACLCHTAFGSGEQAQIKYKKSQRIHKKISLQRKTDKHYSPGYKTLQRIKCIPNLCLSSSKVYTHLVSYTPTTLYNAPNLCFRIQEPTVHSIMHDMYCYRRILHLSRTQRVTNAEVRQRLHIEEDNLVMQAVMRRGLALF